MAGFGYGAASGLHRLTRSSNFVSSSATALAPSPAWTGTAGTGFASVPSDPARTTAKPAAALLVPPGQRFTDTLTVGVSALANNGGTLISGVDRVRFHFEGATRDVLEPTLRTITRQDGTSYLALGYWVTLKKPSGTAGAAQLYVEAIPADATMQSRVIGPFTFHLHDTLYDFDVTCGTGGDHTTLDAAIAAFANASAKNGRVTLTETTTYDVVGFNPNYTSDGGYLKIVAADGVDATISKADANADAWRPRTGPLWLEGVTLDYARIQEIFVEAEQDAVAERCAFLNHSVRGLWFKGLRTAGRTISGGPWFLENRFYGLTDPMNNCSLARGNIAQGGARDVVGRPADGAGIVHNIVDDWQNEFDEADSAVARVNLAYTGTGDPTIARVKGPGGPNEYNSYIFKVDGTTVGEVRAFTKWPKAEDAAATTGSPPVTTCYYVTDWVDAINALDDFTATILPDDGSPVADRAGNNAAAAYLNLLGTVEDAFFGDTAIDGDVDLNFAFGAHSDFVQTQDGGSNLVIAYNQLTHFDGQCLIMVNAEDYVIAGNVFDTGADGVTAFFTNLDDKVTNKTYSHFVLAHNSWRGQRIAIGENIDWDGYSLISNNVAPAIQDNAGDTPGSGNVVDPNQFAPTPTVGLYVEAGDQTTWFPDRDSRDFAPAGALLTNKVAPLITYDTTGTAFAASDASGAKRDGAPGLPALPAVPTLPEVL